MPGPETATLTTHEPPTGAYSIDPPPGEFALPPGDPFAAGAPKGEAVTNDPYMQYVETPTAEKAEAVPGHNFAKIAEFRTATIGPEHEAADAAEAAAADPGFYSRPKDVRAFVETIVDEGRVLLKETGINPPPGKKVLRRWTGLSETESSTKDAITPKAETTLTAPSDQEARVATGTQELRIPKGKNTIGLSGELMPIDTIHTRGPDGRAIKNQVLATLNTGHTGRGSIHLCSNPWGTGLIRLGEGSPQEMVRLHPSGPKEEIASMQVGVDSQGMPEFVMVSHSRSPEDNYDWRISYTGGTPRTIIVSDNVEAVRKPVSGLEAASRREGRTNLGKRVAKIALALAVVYPGGLADKVADPFVGTTEVVQEAGDAMMQKVYGPEDVFDGIKIKDYPPGAAEQFNAEPLQYNKAIERATKAVEQTMADLDSHNYDGIKKRADAYVRAHPGCLMDEKARESMLSAIGSAKDESALKKALQPLEQFSGKTVIPEVGGKYNFADIRSSTKDYASEMSRLPKVIFASSDASIIKIGQVELAGAAGQYGENTSSDGDSKQIVVTGSNDLLTKTIIHSTNFWPMYGAGNNSRSQVIDHEIGHSLPVAGGKSDKTQTNPAWQVVDLLSGGILDYPLVTSSYGRSDPEEERAESLGAVLSNSKTGLAHPDQVRHFVSPGNKLAVEALIDLEANKPGLADLIVSSNPNLMDRKFVVGR